LRGTVLGHGILIVGNAAAFPIQQPEVHGRLRLAVELEAQRGIFRGEFTG
jgi:hypothetical protein